MTAQLSQRAKMAARRMVAALGRNFEQRRYRTTGTITALQRDASGRVVGATATVDGASGQSVQIDVGAPISVGSTLLLENAGTPTAVQWVALRTLETVSPMPGVGDAPTLPTPTGLTVQVQADPLIPGQPLRYGALSHWETIGDEYGFMTYELQYRPNDPGVDPVTVTVPDTPNTFTRLDGAIGAADTLIPRDPWDPDFQAAVFPVVGRVAIEAELIDYTGMTDGTGDSGTGTGSIGQLVDGGKSWDTDEWVDYILTDSGSNTFLIESNNATTLYVTGTPASGAYTIKPGFSGCTRGAGGTSGVAHADNTVVWKKSLATLVSGLLPATDYNFRVRALRPVDGALSTWSAWVSQSTPSDSVPPDDPTGFSVTPIELGLLFEWTGPTYLDNPDLAGFEIYRATASDGTGATLIATVGVQYQHQISASPFEGYYYNIKSVDYSGNSSGYGEDPWLWGAPIAEQFNNPSFEEGSGGSPDGWTLYDSTYITTTWATDDKYDGTYSVKFAVTSGSVGAGQIVLEHDALIAVEKGATAGYRVTFATKSNPISALTTYRWRYYQYQDKDETPCSNAWIDGSDLENHVDWDVAYDLVVFDDDCAYVRPCLIWVGTTYLEAMWVDDFRIQAAVKWMHGVADDDILPWKTYDYNVGSVAKRFHSIHAAVLEVQTIVADEIIATLGGNVLVGPTTMLCEYLDDADTHMHVEHNEMTDGDIAYLLARGNEEYIEIDGYAILVVNQASDYFEVAGDVTGEFTIDTKFTVDGSTGNDGEYTVTSSSTTNGNTRIYVSEEVPNATADGVILYIGPQGAGPYHYVKIVRDKDGGGADDWFSGDAVLNTGQAGDGFIDIYSRHAIQSATAKGPTLVGNIRQSGGYKDWVPGWAIGNLRGLYGYSTGADIYGVGLGEYADGNAIILIDTDNGIRMSTYSGGYTLRGQWQPDGDFFLGRDISDPTTTAMIVFANSQTYNGETTIHAGDILIGDNSTAGAKANILWDHDNGQLLFRGGQTTEAYIDTDGSIAAGGGEVLLNADGITIEMPDTTAAIQNKITWEHATDSNVTFNISAVRPASPTGCVHAYLEADSNTASTGRAITEIWATTNTYSTSLTLYADEASGDAYVSISGDFTVFGGVEISQGLYVGATGTAAGADDIIADGDIFAGNGLVVGATSGSPSADEAIIGDTTITSDSIEINTNGSGDRNAYIDFIGDATYTDYGLRIIRTNTGANAPSNIIHKGTGNLTISCPEGGIFTVSNTDMNFLSGNLYINESANSDQTRGITINQGTATDESFAVKQSQVSHGGYNISEADTVFAVDTVGTNGGVNVLAFKESTSSLAPYGGMNLWGHISENAHTSVSMSTAKQAITNIMGVQVSGGGYTNITGDGLVVGVRTYRGGGLVTIAAIDEDGDLWLDAGGSYGNAVISGSTVSGYNTYDEYDDGALLTGLRASLAPVGSEFRRRNQDFLQYARPVLEAAGIVSYNDGPEDDGRAFLSMRGLAYLTVDAVRQLYDRLEAQERLLDSYGQALVSAGIPLPLEA